MNVSAARSLPKSPLVRAMTARDPHSRRGGLRLGLLYHDRERGITGEAWQHPAHGEAPAHTLRMASGDLVSYLRRFDRLRLATAPERRRYRRAVSRMEGEA